ncbi:MAG TPA: type II toxin-antitoxin system RelE/ParE family toxin [Spirochaetota bacterium]|nr:type II toxin-antitoxin system RelE/ParE family toxin [Spirochaetota bacterium]HOS31989.1 type II toxin-antitoxin system RelE/ParE family toxin [Spirochaetota bacterium]HOS55241.1 type II toxin-antitoxin system RelE/ParE family toxin [Spirochaetota bacterium]HPK61142.1 type II toxin-antitoxin system RelE/ParE family toxin [Spirochaetota bacterium]HQF77756.1 type II toxin-antitoxin system RelE/ParE family toxin [Spirochaetota bacterium]
MVRIFWTDESKKWLREIYEYISLDNEKIAKKVISEIVKKTEILKTFSEIGHKLQDFPNRNIRMLLYGNYRIVYLIKLNSDIDILGVYHGALDLKKHLKVIE